MKECLEDKQVGVVRVHLKAFSDLESAFIDIVFYQVVFGLLVKFLNLRCDQSDKQRNFLMLLF